SYEYERRQVMSQKFRKVLYETIHAHNKLIRRKTKNNGAPKTAKTYQHTPEKYLNNIIHNREYTQI
ncbi:MAG: hypothetical protein Q4D14_07365, partial [Bacteroidales bacterium]|nr:hypothetical protein [Bacteroidales bacterium]